MVLLIVRLEQMKIFVVSAYEFKLNDGNCMQQIQASSVQE